MGWCFPAEYFSWFIIDDACDIVEHLLAVVSALLSLIPGAIGSFALIFGTWIFENKEIVEIVRLSSVSTAVWLVISYMLTIIYELKLITKRLILREQDIPKNIKACVVIFNSTTYALLGTFIYIMWVVDPF